MCACSSGLQTGSNIGFKKNCYFHIIIMIITTMVMYIKVLSVAMSCSENQAIILRPSDNPEKVDVYQKSVHQ
jgi:hypothetical protein